MVHHPNTIKGLHAQRDQNSMRSADLGGKHLSSKSTKVLETLKPFGDRVAKWFDDRKITQNGTLEGQMKKLEEEFNELREALTGDDSDAISDAIGDMAVVLAGIAHMEDMRFEDCQDHAWNEIKDRTGHLNEEGIFVKD